MSPRMNIGDRHLGGLGGEFASAAERSDHGVVISAGASAAATLSGQHILWMLTNLLARQDGVVTDLILEVPDVAALPKAMLLGGGGQRLVSALTRLATSIASDRIRLSSRSSSLPDDAPVQVRFGGSILAACADGWRFAIGDVADLPRARPSSSIAAASYFAACVLAGEVFKAFRRYEKSRNDAFPLFFSLWSFEAADSWVVLDPGLVTLPSLAPFYLVGAGAVGQALLATLIASDVPIEHITSMDGDAIDDEGTNLNRYCLATTGDIGTSKALIAERVLAAHNVSGFAFPGTWEEYQGSNRWGQRADLLSLEASFLYENVLSCVDKNPARHSIQRFWPRVLLGGSTLGMGISVVNYDMQSDFECLMCGNPLPVDSWSVDKQATALRGMTKVERQRLAEAKGADAANVEAYLDDERCGHLGVAEIKKFRLAPGDAEWSVGFVSVAAGALLAVETIRTIGFGVPGSDTGAAHRFTFGSNSSRTTAHRRRQGCECLTSGLTRFKENWPGRKEAEG